MKKGFVDLQVNGWMGISFSDPDLTLQEVHEITLDLAKRGTIAYCPTVVTEHYDTYRHNLPILAEAMEDPELGPHLLGIHMEGPFISIKKGARGAHPRCYVKRAAVAEFDRFQEWARGRIALLTLDPSHRRGADLIRHARAQGVVVAIGHHFAEPADMQKAVEAGATVATHLGNGIPNKIDRHRNPLWWQLACDELWASLITDGHHLPAPLIKVALRAKTPDRVVVVSDASPLAGLPPGQYEAFGMHVVIEESGRIYSRESDSLAGSHATMLECMNFLASLELLDEESLWRLGVDNPLRILGRTPDLLDAIPGPGVTFDGHTFSVGG